MLLEGRHSFLRRAGVGSSNPIICPTQIPLGAYIRAGDGMHTRQCNYLDDLVTDGKSPEEAAQMA